MIKNTAPDQLVITEVVPAYTTIGVLHNLGRDRDIVGRAVFVGGNLATKHLGDSPNTLIDALTTNTTYTFKIGRYDSMSSDSLIAAGFDIDFSTEETVTTKIYPAIAGYQVVAEYVEIGAAPPALDIQLTGDADTVEIEYKATNGQWLPAWYGEFGEKIHVTGLPLGTLDLRVRGVIDIPVAPYKEKSPWLPINGVVMKSTFQAPEAAAAPTTQVSKLAEPTERYDVKVSWTWARGTGSDIRHFILERLDTTLHGTDWANSEKINTGTAKSYTIVNHPFEREFKYRVTAVSWGPEDLNSTISPETALTITSATTIVDLVRDTNLEVNYAHIKATASIGGSPKQTFLLDAATGSLALGKLDAQGNAPVSVDGTNGDVHVDGKVITESIYSANFILTNTTGASNPSLHSISKPTYTDTSTGVYMGHQNDGSFRFNMGNAANYIKWNGTSLDIKGKVTISGGSTGFSELLDAPTSLGELNAAEGSKLGGIAAGADVTDYTAISEDAQAKVDAVEVGGRNLVLNSNVGWVSSGYTLFSYVYSLPPSGSKEYTVSLKGDLTDALQTGFYVNVMDNVNGFPALATFTESDKNAQGVYVKTVIMPDMPQDIAGGFVYAYPLGLNKKASVDWIKIEKGNKATDWTPAPEDVEAYADAQALAAEQAAKDYSDQTFVDVTSYGQDIAQIQTQIDKSITTWFENGEPTLSNAPASSWASNADKDVHLGDLYYDNLTGYSYRFKKSGSVYSWGKISDSDVTAALTAAANAQDTADGKRRVFYATPTAPYDKGDLWDTGSGLKRANTAIAAGATYSAAHWLDVTDGAGAAADAKQQAIDAAALDASSKVDAVEVGGRNIVLDSNVGWVSSGYTLFSYVYSLPPSGSKEYTVSLKGDLTDALQTGFYVNVTDNVNGFRGLATFTESDKNAQGVYVKTVMMPEMPQDIVGGYVYAYPLGLNKEASVDWIKIEKGNKATDWTPAPEDVEAYADAQALAAPKTVIDGGLITTGGITLDGTSGFIKAGKTSFTDMQNPGFWLGQTTAGAAINIGDVNEYMYFRGDTGLRLKTTDLEIGAGGKATFRGGIDVGDTTEYLKFDTTNGLQVKSQDFSINSDGEATFTGSISASDGNFLVQRTGDISDGGSLYTCVVTSTNQYGTGLKSTGVNRGIYARGSGTMGTGVSASGAHVGVYGRGETHAIFGFSGIGNGGKFTSGVSRTSGKGVVDISSTHGAAHISMNTITSRRIPYGSAGDLAVVKQSRGRTELFLCVLTTSDGRGKWQKMRMFEERDGGNLNS